MYIKGKYNGTIRINFKKFIDDDYGDVSSIIDEIEDRLRTAIDSTISDMQIDAKSELKTRMSKVVIYPNKEERQNDKV